MKNLKKHYDDDTIRHSYLPDPSLSPIDPFPYEETSMTHYHNSAYMMEGCGAHDIRRATRHSEKDKAFITDLYPKPCGGAIGLEQTEWRADLQFQAVHKPVPRVVMGIASMS